MDDAAGGKLRKLQISYKESPHYRVVHANGAYGGVSPLGELVMALYSERMQFPDRAVIRFDSNGIPSPEEFQIEQGVVREIEVGVMLDLKSAKSLAEWLEQKIAVLERISKSSEVSEESREPL